MKNLHPSQLSSSVVPAPIKKSYGEKVPGSRDISLFESTINSNVFNAFELHGITKNNSLYFMLQYMYQKFEFGSQLKGFEAAKYQNLSLSIQGAYRDSDPTVRYHTSFHAADVVQQVYFYLFGAGVNDMCKATPLDLASLFLSAAAHDVDHPGSNNLLEIKTHSKLATLYNDSSVLENHHAATLFFMLEDESCNVFAQYSGDEYNKIRKQILENILFTDMSKHFAFLSEIKGMNSLDNFDAAGKQKPDILKALVHAADIGNPSRPFDICKMWALKILSEFFQQGDKERAMGLEISQLCDRKTTNIARSQIGFIDFVVLPYFDALASLMPGMYFAVDQMKQNKEQWTVSIEEYERQREDKGNDAV